MNLLKRLETNLTVEAAGHLEQLRLYQTEYVSLLKNSLNKGEYVMNSLNSKTLSNSVQILLKKNLFSLIKYLAMIQTIFPILFFDDFIFY